MLFIGDKLIDTDRKLSIALKKMYGNTHKVYRDIWLFIEGSNINQVKEDLENMGIIVMDNADDRILICLN